MSGQIAASGKGLVASLAVEALWSGRTRSSTRDRWRGLHVLLGVLKIVSANRQPMGLLKLVNVGKLL